MGRIARFHSLVSHLGRLRFHAFTSFISIASPPPLGPLALNCGGQSKSRCDYPTITKSSFLPSSTDPDPDDILKQPVPAQFVTLPSEALFLLQSCIHLWTSLDRFGRSIQVQVVHPPNPLIMVVAFCLHGQ